MSLATKLRTLPTRVATGGYILHAGLEKWDGDQERAGAIHAMAASAFPGLESVPPAKFLRLLSAAEIATGSALLAPFVSEKVAGLALTAFSGGLVAMYLRSPALRREGSIWPSQAGIAVSKDAWMLAIGLGLLLEAVTSPRKRGA